MKFLVVQSQPKNAQKMLDQLAAQGWRVVAQSESTWVINKCLGLSRSIDSIINYTLAKD
jgi:hypothetical protein